MARSPAFRHGSCLLGTALLLSSCGGSSTPAPAVTFPTATSMSLTGQYRLGPGEERYHCFITKWKRAGGLRIKAAKQTFSPGVHHIGVFTDEVGVEREGQRECADMGIWGFVYGAGPGNSGFDFPEGTALEVADETPIILQLHMLNAQERAIDVDVRVTFDLLKDGVVSQPVGSWITGTTTLAIPSGAGVTDIRTRCTEHPKMENVFAVYPHMHRLGHSLGIEYGLPSTTAQKLFDLPRWNFGDQGTSFIRPNARIDENVPITTRCSYQNDTGHPVQFGLSTHDEMCAVLFYYWPAVGRRASYQLCDG